MVIVLVLVLYALYKHFPASITHPVSRKQDERKIWMGRNLRKFLYFSHPQCKHFVANEHV